MLTVSASRIQVAHKQDTVLGERSRFVSTENVERTQMLDRRQVFDDDMVFRHLHRAFRERGGHDDWQHLRGESHRYGQGKEDSLFPIPFEEAIEEKDQWHHQHHQTHEQPAHVIDASIKARRDRLFHHTLSNQTQKGLAPGCYHDGGCGSTYHTGSHEAQVRFLQDIGMITATGREGLFFIACLCIVLLDGHGFASQQRLTDKEVPGGKQAHISRDHIPCGKSHQVTGNYLSDGNVALDWLCRGICSA